MGYGFSNKITTHGDSFVILLSSSDIFAHFVTTAHIQNKNVCTIIGRYPFLAKWLSKLNTDLERFRMRTWSKQIFVSMDCHWKIEWGQTQRFTFSFNKFKFHHVHTTPTCSTYGVKHIGLIGTCVHKCEGTSALAATHKDDIANQGELSGRFAFFF